MKLLKVLISFLPFLFISMSVTSQEEINKEPQASTSNTIQNQFDKLYKKSYKWTDPQTGQQYRTININNLFIFRNNVYDSIKQATNKFALSQNTIGEQKILIDSLKAKLTGTSESLIAVTKEKDIINMNLFHFVERFNDKSEIKFEYNNNINQIYTNIDIFYNNLATPFEDLPTYKTLYDIFFIKRNVDGCNINSDLIS